MRAAKRLQLSSQLSDTARAVLEPGIGAPLLLPVFWAEEASQVRDQAMVGGGRGVGWGGGRLQVVGLRSLLLWGVWEK